ncbi:putative beta-lysine N-acetyltransferase [Bacillus tianshenii]|uniref:Beta-lysine N-acetyltransferase n=1 Tax=Sutcliffiella tianshenii TaxID=1463404 RepID=A0ABS2NXP9_9BACI|nr:putative beta-lysine N-acetyltransferase [Bacillus tianshenii]
MGKINGEYIILQNERFYLKGYKDFANERLKIEDYRGNLESIFTAIHELEKEKYVHKTIIKCRTENVTSFLSKGYLLEASIPGYFLGSTAFFLCKYDDQNRYTSAKWIEEDQQLEEVWKKDRNTENAGVSTSSIRKATTHDAKRLSTFYAGVFPIYPVPIDDPDYISSQMEENTIFHYLEVDGQIIAAASAEVNMEYRNAEITDCATLSSHRKGGSMNSIIQSLENELISKRVFCSYSIARALSFGMNAVLHKSGYTYQGRLKNNCYIYDSIEDMNVWYKDLSFHFAEKSALSAGN